MKLNIRLQSFAWPSITTTSRAFHPKCISHVRSASVRHLSKGPSKSRFETFQVKLRERYPNISSSQLPSLTVAFVLLHELTAIIPLIGTFFIFQSTGMGEKIVDWIKITIVEPSDIQLEKSSAKFTNWLRSFISTAFEEGSNKISRIAVRYGWTNTDIPKSSARPDADQVLSMIDSSILASGLVAYLSVKALLPLRIGLSLYLAPSFARYFRSFYPSFQRRKLQSTQVEKDGIKH